MEPEDIDLLYDIENDSGQWAVGSANMPYSREFLRQYILLTTGDIFTDKQVRLVIEANGIPAGLADLTSFDPKNLRAEVGIMILPAFRNQGIATKAVNLLLSYAEEIIHLHQLYAIVPESNICSAKLFSKCGFTDVCPLKDWLFDGKNYQNAKLLQKIF